MPAFTWDIDPILFRVPFLPGGGVRYYSLLYVCVFLGGYKLLDWQLRRAGAREEDGSDFVLYGVIAVLGGARFGHVFFYEWDRFVAKLGDDPFWVFRIWEGGLASHGATIGLLLAMWLFTYRRGQSFIEGCDRFSFSAALGATLIRLGNFFNSEIVGRVTNADWGVRFPRYDRVAEPPLRHPSQLYEVALGLLVIGVLLWADKLLGKEKRPRGAMIALFFAVYFTGRFLVEYVKEHQALDPSSPLTMGQILSIPAALAGFIGLAVALKKKVPAEWYTDDEDDKEAQKRASDEDADDEDDEDDAEVGAGHGEKDEGEPVR